MSRTKNSLKNIKYALIGQISALLISFIARMVFVQTLNSEYLGINGLFSNILSILSLAELGVGAAIVYSLYKPLADRDVPKIQALMALFQRTYISIGIVIAVIGVAIMPLIPYLIKEMPNIPHIRLIYLMYIINTAISYFYSYKRSLIIADQKRYIATNFRYGFFVLLNIAQIIVLLLTKNFIFFLSLQIVFTFLENFFISKVANNLYPYIKKKTSINLDEETKSSIFRNIKAITFHKIGGIVVNGSSNLLISKYIGVVAVGLYSNYFLVASAINTVFGMIFQAITASVGNLGATESKEKLHYIFKCINLLGFWIYGWASICLVILFNPFINLWLGNEYLFPMFIVVIIVINFFLTGMRKSVLTFRDALGLYWYDRYKPLFEVSINLIFSIILAKEIGLAGVFLGTIISTVSTCLWVEPYVLYKYGFKVSLASYFTRYLSFSIILLVTGSITWIVCSYLRHETILFFIMKLTVAIILPNLIFLLFFWRTSEFKYILSAVLKAVKPKNRNSIVQNS